MRTNPVEAAFGLFPAIFFIILSRFLRIISSVVSSVTLLEAEAAVEFGAATVLLHNKFSVKRPKAQDLPCNVLSVYCSIKSRFNTERDLWPDYSYRTPEERIIPIKRASIITDSTVHLFYDLANS